MISESTASINYCRSNRRRVLGAATFEICFGGAAPELLIRLFCSMDVTVLQLRCFAASYDRPTSSFLQLAAADNVSRLSPTHHVRLNGCTFEIYQLSDRSFADPCGTRWNA